MWSLSTKPEDVFLPYPSSFPGAVLAKMWIHFFLFVFHVVVVFSSLNSHPINCLRQRNASVEMHDLRDVFPPFAFYLNNQISLFLSGVI